MRGVYSAATHEAVPIYTVPTHALASVLVVLIAIAPACRGSAHESAEAPPPGRAAWFVDRAEEGGLRFVHVNGMTGRHYFREVMPPGAGLLDFDNDGDLDVFLVQGQLLGTPSSDAGVPAASHAGGRLFRNDLSVGADGTRSMRFVDVTVQSGIRANGYGMGVAAGDIDNDGWVDLYLTNFGSNQLYRNNHDGTFTDVSHQSGTADNGFSVSAAFVDYDRDGWLDLYVANDGDEDLFMTELNGEGSNLYVNDGKALFEDRSASSGLGAASLQYTGFGTGWFDFDNDGWLDLLSVNGRVQAAEGTTADAFPTHHPKLLFRNLHDGRLPDGP